MKKLKISLAAIAFVVASGLALSTNATTSDLPECTSAHNCDETINPECCYVDLGGGARDIKQFVQE